MARIKLFSNDVSWLIMSHLRIGSVFSFITPYLLRKMDERRILHVVVFRLHFPIQSNYTFRSSVVLLIVNFTWIPLFLSIYTNSFNVLLSILTAEIWILPVYVWKLQFSLGEVVIFYFIYIFLHSNIKSLFLF